MICGITSGRETAKFSGADSDDDDCRRIHTIVPHELERVEEEEEDRIVRQEQQH
jgi:hypothetical protein